MTSSDSPTTLQQQILQLNRDCDYCDCCKINKVDLETLLHQENLSESATLFADTLIFVAESAIKQQQELIFAIEEIVNLASYQQLVLADAPAIALKTTKAHGVFLGYDFHLTPDSSQLIEINTNAGGALLNAVLLSMKNRAIRQQIEHKVLAMFDAEWRAEREAQVLKTIAIVDEQPMQQGLWVEFELFKRLFEQQGLQVVICDAYELSYRDDALWYGELKIDLVYNRLTDFYLEKLGHQALGSAYLNNAVVVTPHPRAHALYADKKNLAILTDPNLLQTLGVNQETIRLLLENIAHTICVRPEDAEALWAKRKQLFFKPRKGYGSKAVYRGDKLTKRVFAEILASDYVAQTLVPPSERKYHDSYLKFDVRQYAYQTQVLLISGRLYQGQTTNFRTYGGGFAQVEIVSNEQKLSCQE